MTLPDLHRKLPPLAQSVSWDGQEDLLTAEPWLRHLADMQDHLARRGLHPHEDFQRMPPIKSLPVAPYRQRTSLPRLSSIHLPRPPYPETHA